MGLVFQVAVAFLVQLPIVPYAQKMLISAQSVIKDLDFQVILAEFVMI
jgi:hypothetical protein